jgi:hypothetical protein
MITDRMLKMFKEKIGGGIEKSDKEARH